MKVLIVDDEVIVAKALCRAFEARGHKVFVAHSGEEGLEIWSQASPDIILLDVVMPGLTGPQVLEESKNRDLKLRPAKVILMSAHSGIKGLGSAVELGAIDFIQKPFDNIFNLVARIEKMT